MSKKLGKFYGVSVGPGAPDLLTLRAHRILTQVPVIAYPSCKPGASSYAWRIVREYITDDQERLSLIFPMNKDWSALLPAWQASARSIAAHLRDGRDVAFITEGDAMLYSTLLHVLEVLKIELPELDYEVVPGVSSINASAALAGRALGQGDERIAIIPATWRLADIKLALQTYDVVVLMKVARVLPQIIDLLAEVGRTKDATLVSRGTAEQSIVTTDLSRFRERRLNYLTQVLVSRDISFVERLGLHGISHTAGASA